MLRGYASPGATGNRAESFGLWAADVGAGGKRGESQQRDEGEGLPKRHVNLGVRGHPNGTCPLRPLNACFLTSTVDFLSK